MSQKTRWGSAALVLALWGCGPETIDGTVEDEAHTEETAEAVAQELSIPSPVPGYGVSTPFGRRGSWAAGYHTGDDYAAPTGRAVVATRAGRVIGAGWNIWGPSYGLQVIVETNGVRHLYAHLSRRDVSVGQWVTQGQRLGAVGSTGNSTGPHCHYEERVAPYGYYNHRRPQFNRTAPPKTPSSSSGFKSWVPGTSHADITGLQRALVSAGCDVAGKYTDFYGDGTRAAVACFQRKQGWSGSDADGVVGPATADRLNLVGDVFVARLRHGVEDSDSVRMLQQRLNEVLGTSLPITGTYGQLTQDAAQRWQRSIGDTGAAADGNIGPRQAERLFPSHRYDVL